MPPKIKKRSSQYVSEDNLAEEAEPDKKKSKHSGVPTGEQFTDADGNPYWELGGRLRRVSLRVFNDQTLVDIREHYEKDGKVLPGKKGISLSIEQFDAFLSVLPQLDSLLRKDGHDLTRPVYEQAAEVCDGSESEEDTRKVKKGTKTPKGRVKEEGASNEDDDSE